MYKKLYRQMNIKKLLSQNENKKAEEPKKPEDSLSVSLQTNLKRIRTFFNEASDFNIREFKIGTENCVQAALLFIDGLVDIKVIDECILQPLMIEIRLTPPHQDISKNDFFIMIKDSLACGKLKEVNTLEDVVASVLLGESALLLEGFTTALIAGTRGFESRGVTESNTEAVVRGPREGFTEDLRTNTSLLRRKIQNTNLKLVSLKIGKQTKTNVCIAYLAGIANEMIVEEVKRRLYRIDTDAILESVLRPLAC